MLVAAVILLGAETPAMAQTESFTDQPQFITTKTKEK